MALPSFTVTGNVFEIDGDTTSSVLDETAPTTYRVSFTTNLSPTSDLVAYDGSLYKLDIVYAGIESDGSLTHATMTAGGVLTLDADPIVLVAANGLSVVNFQYRFQLEKPVGNAWQPLTNFWFDAPAGGATVDLADVVPVARTDRWRGPRADVVSGYFNDDDDLVLVNVDNSETTPIGPIPDGALVWVDNGDGTWEVS